MIGQVYKADSSVYEVNCNGQTYLCTAKGQFKKEKNTILTGDFVEFDEKIITAVMPRKNLFTRPSVANADAVLVIVSPEPKPDYYLIDKLILNAFYNNIEIIIAVNKTDIDQRLFNEIFQQYSKCGIKILMVSAKYRYGIERLKELLSGRLTVLAGQSAAGKTSLVNAIFGLSLKTGELSRKVSRGKHTTTFSRIYDDDNVKIIDTPGFAVIDAYIGADDLPSFYPEYFSLSNKCRFRGCTHLTEPGCEVKKCVENGSLSEKRYLRYKDIFNELVNRRIYYEKH